jgi:polar amino acid transport system substrate-binding protein
MRPGTPHPLQGTEHAVNVTGMQVTCAAKQLIPGLVAAAMTMGAPFASAQTELRVSVSSSWHLPYADVKNGQLQSGILLDLYQAIGQRAGLSVVPVVLPRKRIDTAANNGEIDLRCQISPKWTAFASHYDWSKPLFMLRDVLIAPENAAALGSISGIPAGTLVSTTLGYAYPTLEAQFADGRLRRDDSVDEEKVLLKLTAKRTPYGVVNSLALDWYRKTTPSHQLAPWTLEIDRHPIHCAVPRSAAIPAARTLAAIEDLQKAGRIDAILSAYR